MSGRGFFSRCTFWPRPRPRPQRLSSQRHMMSQSQPRRNTTVTTIQAHAISAPSSFEYELTPCFEGEEQILKSWKYTWKISNFTGLTRKKYYSEAFTIDGNSWRLLLFPRGNHTQHLSIYMDTADSENLASGWSRYARFRLILIDQNNFNSSKIKETAHTFTAREYDWGFTSFISLTELHDSGKGYLLNNSLKVVAEIFVPLPPSPVNPPAADNTTMATPTDVFDSYFKKLEELINTTESSPARVGSSLSPHRSPASTSAPSLEEVEEAKQSLKECLSDIFKLNVKDRLAEAVLTLSSAKTGLSTKQQETIKAFRANFDEFTSDFLTFEQDNAEFELKKLLKDQMLGIMEKNLENHASYTQLMGDLNEEEEELKRKLEGVKSRREKLVSEWEILMVETEEAKSGYTAQEKKVAEAEEKKRIAEERMSRSTKAWSNLKELFG